MKFDGDSFSISMENGSQETGDKDFSHSKTSKPNLIVIDRRLIQIEES